MAAAAFSQEPVQVKHRPEFGSLNLGGVLLGQSASEVQVQTINGIRFNRYFAGIGVGLDPYFERTLPVFLDLRKDLLRKKQTPFLYADGGYHFLWLKQKSIFESGQKSGWFYEAGFGYSLPLNRRIHLLMSGGYSYKTFSKTVNTTPWISIWPAPHDAFQHFDYQLRRVSLKIGVDF